VSDPLDSPSDGHPQRGYREFTRAGLHPGGEAAAGVIFKSVRDGRPYPDHGFTSRDWSQIPPHQVRLDELVTTKRELRLDTLLDEDSTFYGDLFPHAVRWRGELYLETGLHRALRAALQQRHVIHVRVLDLDDPMIQVKPT
jgi:Arc/MetJ family transcription regulator